MLQRLIASGLMSCCLFNFALPMMANLPDQPLINTRYTEERTPYILGPGDRLQVELSNVPEYNKEYPVLVDGTINLYLIGPTPVKGLTLPEVNSLITQLYLKLVKNPLVNVNLIGLRPLTIAIAGQVSMPGIYTLNFGEGSGGLQFPNVVQAIETAKGITALGDLQNVEIRRQQKPGFPTLNRTINLWQFLQTGELPADITLRDGDTIFVPAVSEVDLTELRQRANASFSADLTKPVSVVIVGEVHRPGPYTVFATDAVSTGSENTLDSISIQDSTTLAGLPTVTRALRIAGGITAQANIREIQIRRRLFTGQEKVLTLNLWNLLKTADINQDLLLQAGDSIIVPKAEQVDINEAPQIAAASFSPNTIQVNLVGELSKPGSVSVPLNTSLNQAILTSGGFNPQRASRANVQLIRENRNGTVFVRTYEVDFSQGLDEKSNPPLQNNDVIIVSANGLTRFSDKVETIMRPFTTFTAGFIGVINFVDFLDTSFGFGILNDENSNNNN
ncbi:MAG: polysaccharide biosynthesis/export family protein [Microcoleaceae cyanobacterium]